VKKLIKFNSSFVPKIFKNGSQEFYMHIHKPCYQEEKEKIKPGREDFFFTSLILTTVSDVYNVLRLDNSVSGPFQ